MNKITINHTIESYQGWLEVEDKLIAENCSDDAVMYLESLFSDIIDKFEYNHALHKGDGPEAFDDLVLDTITSVLSANDFVDIRGKGQIHLSVSYAVRLYLAMIGKQETPEYKEQLKTVASEILNQEAVGIGSDK